MAARIREISAGEYEIGDEQLPHAGPRHVRLLPKSVWIDAVPLSWAHFEVFVAAGGYSRDDFWQLPKSPSPAPGANVDVRVLELLQMSQGIRSRLSGRGPWQASRPLTGVTWFEALAICRFYQARLPFEAEWEVAMRGRSASGEGDDRFPASSCGCAVMIGTLQEWTADAFSARYWRGDREIGRLWSADRGAEVSVRGAAASDMHQHPSARFGRAPSVGHAYCGLRRVWDYVPKPAQFEPTWRHP